MKYLSEYRNLEATKHYLALIEKKITKPWKIMEICGGQTHSLVRNGILELLPKNVQMIHGPGCPVRGRAVEDHSASTPSRHWPHRRELGCSRIR